jgi:hypothetical protein
MRCLFPEMSDGCPPLAVAYEVSQDIEHLGLDRNGLGSPAQFPAIGVE